MSIVNARHKKIQPLGVSICCVYETRDQRFLTQEILKILQWDTVLKTNILRFSN